jgi:hypothetical protein
MMPNLGQGGCQAIEDAYVLTEILAKTKTTEKIEDGLQEFYRKRILRASAVQFLSRLASDLIINAFDTPWSPHDNLGKSWKSYLTFFWKVCVRYFRLLCLQLPLLTIVHSPCLSLSCNTLFFPPNLPSFTRSILLADLMKLLSNLRKGGKSSTWRAPKKPLPRKMQVSSAKRVLPFSKRLRNQGLLSRPRRIKLIGVIAKLLATIYCLYLSIVFSAFLGYFVCSVSLGRFCYK